MSSRPRSSYASSSPRLAPAILVWINALAPSLPSLSERDESTGKPKRVVEQLSDLRDGLVLGEIACQVDPDYFRLLATAGNTKALAENWVLRFNHLKRLYKLIITYFEEVLRSSMTNLLAPNLQMIAKGEAGSDEEICRLAGLVLALTVQSDSRKQHVERIQSLDEWVQRQIMWSIEQVMSKVGPRKTLGAEEVKELDPDSEFYAMQHERSQLLNDKDTIQSDYEELLRNFNALKEDHEEALAGLAKAEAREAEVTSALSASKSSQPDRTAKAEVDRLRTELQKTENQLGELESVSQEQTRVIDELKRKVEELAPRAEEATKLKDQMDEYRHAAEKAKKTENALEKYKKKLEEQADLRRAIRTLEEQNSTLLDKNASLEEDYEKVSSFKPLMDSYKAQLDALEAKSSALVKDNDILKHELQRAKEKLIGVQQEREREGEALTLYEERVRELELDGKKGRRRPQNGGSDEEDSFDGVGGELEDAVSGTTTTDLKLKIRKLTRELEQAKTNRADASRIVMLENLLDDSNRMKKRYEDEYLQEHRDKLVVEGKLEEIMSGKSRLGDGPEAAMALRQRLNETVDELDSLRRSNAELVVKSEKQSDELTIAKSDLTLVNKDQLDVLKTLRASVSVEKEALAKELERLRASLRSAEDKVKMQTSQVNTLLLEKVSLQNDGIGQREKLLERERDYSDLRASTSSRGLSEADQARLSTLEEENKQYQKDVREMQEKLQKAKAFIKQQDKLFKEAHASEHHGDFEQAEQSLRSQISTLTEELHRQKTNNSEVEARYRREQQLMLSAWHDLGMRSMREGVAAAASGSQSQQPKSWLAQQRVRSNGKGLRHA